MIRQARVLVVDDLEKWREELVETLQHGGFEVDSASVASQALEQLNKSPYHVLVLDIRMVDADQSNTGGIELLKELEKRGLSEATKVIILSAYGTKEQMRVAFRDHKVADFLSKDDFNNRAFLESVRQVFSKEVNINLALDILW